MASYKVLSYQELRKIVWFIADTIRDKGRGGVSDYMSITVGITFLKRFIDMRAGFKEKFLQPGTTENSIFMLNHKDIDLTIKNHQSKVPEFEVVTDSLWTYRLEWHDIVSYVKNDEMIEYSDGLGGAKFVGAFDNKAMLFKEAMNGFKHHTLHEMFETLDFIPKVYSTERNKQVLDFADFELVVSELDKYNFDLTYVNDDIFNHVYMDLMGRFATDGGKKGGEFFTPTGVVRGAIKFLNVKFKERKIIVSDLAAGACTFMVEFAKAYKNVFNDYFQGNTDVKFNDYVEFVTCEKEPISKVLGDANILSAGYSNNHKSFHANSVTEYDEYLGGYCSGKVDFLLANPPYGLNDYGYDLILGQKEKQRWSFGVPNKGEGEYAFILTALDMLNDEGKAVIVLPLGTLFKDITATYREKIIGKDWLEGIVLLPYNMFHTTGIPVCLWVINKKKEIKDQNKIFIVNASNDFVKNGKLNEWNDEKSSGAYNNREEIKGYSGYVNLEKLIKNKYNLSVSRYVSEEKIKKEIDLSVINKEAQLLISLISSDMKEMDVIINQVLDVSKKD
jgi:type I restriction-modification system DNA methylase subunit